LCLYNLAVQLIAYAATLYCFYLRCIEQVVVVVVVVDDDDKSTNQMSSNAVDLAVYTLSIILFTRRLLHIFLVEYFQTTGTI